MYPLPRNESQRLAQLKAVEIVDTPESSNFDRICALAQDHFQVPAAFISFVDADRQWFKARSGIPFTSTPRSVAICSHTILQDDIFIVQDLQADERFRTNALVTGEPHLRFYAGAPIAFSPGVRLGAVCVADRTPRKLDARQQAFLKHLADVAVSELRLLQATRAYLRRS